MQSISTNIFQQSGECRIAEIKMNAPRGNMLTLSLLDELIRVLQSLRTEQCGCLVISGGNHVFSVGADPKQLLALETCEEVLERLSQTNDLIAKFEGITIAAIAGYALGGGAELALACDFIVGNETSKIGFPEVSIGVIPGGGATVRLPHRIGVAKSIELILTGRVLSGTEALSINLIDSFTGSIQPSKWSREFAEQITRSNHNQIHSVKQLLRASFEDRSVLLTKERSLLVQILRNKAN
jgi:enoyl-CoA hydratase/carnithine racemase